MMFCFFFLMIRRPPLSTRSDTLFPYTTLFRSPLGDGLLAGDRQRRVHQFRMPREDAGHEAVGDAFDVVRADLAAQDGLRLGRLHREQPHVRVDRPEGLADADRAEEQTSELKSLMRISYAVFCLKHKNKIKSRAT